jgi:hypothetical protein
VYSATCLRSASFDPVIGQLGFRAIQAGFREGAGFLRGAHAEQSLPRADGRERPRNVPAAIFFTGTGC